MRVKNGPLRLVITEKTKPKHSLSLLRFGSPQMCKTSAMLENTKNGDYEDLHFFLSPSLFKITLSNSFPFSFYGFINRKLHFTKSEWITGISESGACIVNKQFSYRNDMRHTSCNWFQRTVCHSWSRSWVSDCAQKKGLHVCACAHWRLRLSYNEWHMRFVGVPGKGPVPLNPN